MPARFCPQCGTPAAPKAKYCIECGASLTGGGASAAAARGGGWQLTAVGGSVLGFFLVAGLGIWAAILSPEGPKPGPGRGAGRPNASQAQATAQDDLPPDHPRVPIQIPAEVKTFIDDLAKKASADPKDIATWSRLAQVYYRTSQVDPAYYDKARETYEHILEIDPKNADALRGLASVHFEQDEPDEAIALYERYLAIKPDDQPTRTALGASYLSAGNVEKATAILRDVIAKKPDTWPAQYYLGIALDQQGDKAAGLAAVKKARELATEPSVRAQIDQTIARMSGQPPAAATAEDTSPAAAPAASLTPFQKEVEDAFRAHQIMGPRIARIDWTTPGTARVVMRNFPMGGMPDEVKQKFTSRLADTLRDAAAKNPPGGRVKVEIADETSGAVMATVEPSAGTPEKPSAAANATPFQKEVEDAFRAHQIMGPRIARIDWTTPGTARVVMRNFPMGGMPDEVKQKFTSRLADTLRDAAAKNPPGGPVKVEITDEGSGAVMATVVPSAGAS
ncbi:MAG TPA: tetratricopeptide repeat protein [Candidatus Eisenbacteria bacterium]|nr:tetratricopeptide repeat protein [Candidatus Eisenbacteria bacterium]